MTDTEATYSIGPGVQASMAEHDDVPRSDEQFVILREGHQVSMTFGRDAMYIYIAEDNRTNRLPFRR